MIIKLGDIVTCKNNDQCGGPGILTVGKEYKVVKVDEVERVGANGVRSEKKFVWVINDEGRQDDFSSSRFTLDNLEQHIRQIKEEIGI
jgi:hypothetical protein